MVTAILCTLLILSPAPQDQQRQGQQGQQGRRRTQTNRPATPPAFDTQAAPAQPANSIQEITPSITHHSIELSSGTLKYTAQAAQIPLRNDAGEVECRMFYVAYTKDDAQDRPVTFAFNGGPGSASLWLHMGALGPKRAPLNDDGSMPAPPYVAADNTETWLDFTDVVMIDAPNTGYSRIARPDLASRYFGVRPDIQAFGNFVRTWLNEHHRWRSPIFIAGESYGGIRGSGLSLQLLNEGIAINGFVSISGTSNFMTLDGMRGNDLTYMSFLPSMSACAMYHHRLGSRFTNVDSLVKEVQAWTDKEYMPALERGDSLTEAEKDHIAAKLSEYLGLPKDYCKDSNLRVPEFAFFRELLHDKRLAIGRYDGRLTGKQELGVPSGRGGGDPSDDAVSPPFTSAINDYLDRDLGVHTDMTYNASGNVYPWSEPEGSYSETASDLRDALSKNQHMRVMYCCGYYDLACPLNGTVYTVNHMGLDAETRSHISFAFYPAGHMMYIEKSSRIKLHNDVKAFEEACLAAK